MTHQEFEQFIDYFGAALPELAAWLQKCPDETLKVWERVLIRCELGDCKAAVDRILGGTEPFPTPWSAFPGRIRGLASNEALRRGREQAVLRGSEEVSPTNGFNSGELYRFVIECRDAGLTKEESQLLIEKKFPVDEDKLPRFACLHCWDTGHVSVWHGNSLKSLFRKDQPLRKYSALALCFCAAGKGRHADSGGVFHQPPNMLTYDPDRMAPWLDGNEQDFREWAKDWWDRRAERKATNQKTFEECTPF